MVPPHRYGTPSCVSAWRTALAATAFGAVSVDPSGSLTATPSPNVAASGVVLGDSAAPKCEAKDDSPFDSPPPEPDPRPEPKADPRPPAEPSPEPGPDHPPPEPIGAPAGIDAGTVAAGCVTVAA